MATTATTDAQASGYALADVHYGLASAKTTEREAVLGQARVKHPEWFITGSQITPKIRTTPDEALIYNPA
jgi:hypothetical protein